MISTVFLSLLYSLLWYLAKGIDFIWYIPPCFGPDLSRVLSTRKARQSWMGRGAGVGRLRFFSCLFVVGFMPVGIDAPDCRDQIWRLGFLLAVLMLLWLELGVARKATTISNKQWFVSSCRCGFSLLRFLFRPSLEARGGGTQRGPCINEEWL
jgi:hypothetical protein